MSPETKDDAINRIRERNEATDRTVPWQVALYNNKIKPGHITCGGTLISASHVLTDYTECLWHLEGYKRFDTEPKDLEVKVGLLFIIQPDYKILLLKVNKYYLLLRK